MIWLTKLNLEQGESKRLEVRKRLLIYQFDSPISFSNRIRKKGA